ncbi:MAG: phosphomannomutase/phosphoglucomutase [Gammaproteobacteria bacterium]|nr:phosphomannomutase/phosphoglucomutase [Gammaproteobacteria bacterium]
MEGAHPGMEQLIPNLPRLGVKGPVKPVSKGLTGDDITMIAKRDQLQPGGKDPAGPEKGQAPAGRPAPAAAKRAPKDQAPKAKAPAPAAPKKAAQTESEAVQLSPGIFRAYDIRGVVGRTLSAGIMEAIGQAIGSEAKARGVDVLALGRDGRNSSPELAEALGKGLRNAGRNVIDIGMVPTPLLYFATHHLEVGGGVMVTGSHNGPEYNGVKIVLAGESLSGDAIRELFQRIMDDRLEGGSGEIHSNDIVADYVRRVSEDIPVALGGAFKLVVDCGNGVAGGVAPKLLQALGHDVVELFCEVDGRFPNHQPDPSQPENLETLRAWVAESQADLGLAFDGDGDRLGVVDGDGNIIWPDRQLMLLARDVLSRNPGAPIIFDVKCSRHLRKVIEEAGGKPYMWRTGHSLIKSKMKELDAPLAGEMSGHVFFKERWYGFDDALYTAARLLEVLMKEKRKPAEVFADLPQGVSTPELRVELPESEHAVFMGNLSQLISFDGAEVSDIDGFRVEFPDGWGLVRPSNTSPVLVLRFEAESEASLQRIQGLFRDALRTVKPDLKLPF